MDDRYKQLLLAIEAERKAEEAYFLDVVANKTIHQKVSSGFAWYPIQINAKYYTVGEYIEVEVERTKDIDKPHKIKEGVGAKLFFNHQNEETEYHGVISMVRKNTMKIMLRTDANLNDIHDKGLKGIEMIYDERPFTTMKNAIQEVISSKDQATKELRETVRHRGFTHERQIDADTYQYENDRLNASQIRAVAGCMLAERMGIIHGPPGTGKTTTIVALASEICKTEKRILVCAPSNNAVDLLTIRLNEAGLNVLRIGNVTRIGDEIMHLTLAEKVRNHKEWNHIKKVKIQAEEAKKLASQYKRNFGKEQYQDRKQLQQESRDLRQWARDLEDKLTEEVLQEAQVVLTTLSGASSDSVANLHFKTLIIDEASQAVEPDCWNAILHCERVIMAGDHKQLPPTVKSREAVLLGLEETILDRMTNRIYHSYLLNTQYRMNEKIHQFPNESFYEGKLIAHEKVAQRLLRNDASPLVFIDTAGTGFDEMMNNETRSLSNHGEFFIMREHIMAHSELLAGAEIGIISPYAEQVRYIRDQIYEDADLRAINIEVDTIDGFQGQEKEVIYISLVRSNPDGETGFLKDERRLNVSLTRAKKKLIIIGDSATLSGMEIYSKLIEHVEKHGTYLSAWEYMG